MVPLYFRKCYLSLLFLITSFYILPSIQFVIYQLQIDNEKTDNICYFNNKCSYPLGAVHSFNNLLSNIGYILLGLAFYTKVKRNIKKYHIPPEEASIFSALGMSLTLEGIFSSIYHVCPSRINFQFDTTYMIIGTGLLVYCYLKKRNNLIEINPIKIYIFFAVLVTINSLQLTYFLHNGFIIFLWVITFLFYAYISVFFHLNFIYPTSKFKFSLQYIYSLKKDFKKIARLPSTIFFIGINSLNVVIFVFSFTLRTQFSTLFVSTLIINLVCVKLYYVFSKRVKNEIIRRRVYFYTISAFVCWIVALYFYAIPTYNKFLTPSESLKLNKPCIVFNYFDTHDVWHFISAAAIYLMLLSTWNMDISKYVIEHMSNSMNNYYDKDQEDNTQVRKNISDLLPKDHNKNRLKPPSPVFSDKISNASPSTYHKL